MSGGEQARTADVERVVRDETPALLKYFLRRVDDREDAADLLSETLLTVWRRVEKLPSDPVEARMWLFGIASHVLQNARRTLRRRSALAERLRADLSVRNGGDDASADLRLDVTRALGSLPSRDRELVRLVHWDGLSLAEAAGVVGLNASTARTRYARARAKLAAQLAPDAESDSGRHSERRAAAPERAAASARTLDSWNSAG